MQFPLPLCGDPARAGGAQGTEPLHRFSAHSCSPTLFFYEVLPKPQPWGAPGLSAWADDEVCWMPGRIWTGWEAGAGMHSRAGDQLLQCLGSEEVLGMAAYPSVGETASRGLLAPLHPTAGDGDFPRC